MAEKKEKVELEIKETVPESTENNKKTLENFDETLKNNNKKLSTLEKEIKNIIDKLDTFEFDTEEELNKKESEPMNKKNKSGMFIIFFIIGILTLWALKDKIKNGIKQKNEVN